MPGSRNRNTLEKTWTEGEPSSQHSQGVRHIRKCLEGKSIKTSSQIAICLPLLVYKTLS